MSAYQEFRAARDFLLENRENFETAYERFRWPELTEFNFALDWFDKLAELPERKDQDALLIVEQDGSKTRLSFAELSARSSQTANWFRKLGMKRGDRFMVMLDNQVELWEAMLASFKVGAVLLPTTTMLSAAGLQERVDRAQISWALTNPKNSSKFLHVSGDFTVLETGEPTEHRIEPIHEYVAYRDAAAEPTTFEPDAPTSASDPAIIYFTSGTTSQSKMVEHTHVSYPVGMLSTFYWIGIEPGDVHLNVASPGWGKHAWSNFFSPWIGESTVFIYNYSRFDAPALMKAMDDEHVASFCAPPTVWRMLIQADLHSLKNPPRKVVAAGEPLNPTVINAVQEAWGVNVRDGYGQTETTLQIANFPGQPMTAGSVGKPAPGYYLEIIDEQTGDIIEGAGEGEVCICLDKRPLALTPGYIGDPAKTAKTFRNGLYRTGDVMKRDKDGMFTYIGRADDLFKSSDYKLSPFELESLAMGHTAISEVAVVPSPDPIRLSVPKAYVVLRDGYEPNAETAESILRYCKRAIPPFGRIRRLEFLDLPKTVSGKIRRVELREREIEFHGPNGEKTAESLAARTTDGGFGHEYQYSAFPELKKA